MGVPAHIPPARRLPRGCSHSRMCKVTVYEKFRLEKKEKLMIEPYFSRYSTITRLRCGPLGSDLDERATTLHQQGYTWESIRGYLRGCDQFGRWLSQQGYAVADVNPTLVRHYISGLQRPPSGRLPEGAQGLSHLLQLWRQHNRLLGGCPRNNPSGLSMCSCRV